MQEPWRSLALVAATLTLIMGVMWWSFDALLERRYNPNSGIDTSASGPTHIALRADPAGQYVVPGTINGHKVRFLLDTGATHVAVPQHLAQQLGLEPGRRIRVDTAGGRVTARATVLDRVSIGGIRRSGVRGTISPGLSGDFVLLGMTFLRDVDFRREGGRLVLSDGR